MASSLNPLQKWHMRRDVCARYHGACAYCRKHVGFRLGTVDHYVPQTLGGTHDPENLRWACKPCNDEKGDMPPDDWEQLIASRPKARATKYEIRCELLRRCAARPAAPAKSGTNERPA